MVPADSLVPGMSGKSDEGKPIDDPFAEFDHPSALDIAIDAQTKARKVTV
jgi:hypothetical protein